MVGLLGLGVGFNLFGTYYILLQSGALPPSMTPAGANAAKDKQGAAAEGTQGGGGGVAAAAPAIIAAEQATPVWTKRWRWW